MSVYDVLVHHGVSRLCHFTKLQNLSHILGSAKGILATGQITLDSKNINDEVRADGALDYVCCSIEYPNSWYFGKAKQRNVDTIFKTWVIVLVDVKIVKLRDIKVSQGNAAKGCGAYVREGSDSTAEELFGEYVETYRGRRPEKMLDCCTTDGQAEVLVKDNIPRDYITGIIVGDEQTAERVFAMQRTLGIDEIDIFIAPDVVTTRWNEIVREGSKPEETEYLPLDEA